MDSISTLPADISKGRELFFNLPVPFSVRLKDYLLIWPLIDNVYSIRNSSQAFTRHYVTKNIECRFRRSTPSRPKSTNWQTSKKTARSCAVVFKIMEFANHVEVWGGATTNHSHSLDFSDSYKRNSFLRALVQKEIARAGPSVSHAMIMKTIRSADNDPLSCAQLEAIGGKYLDTSCVKNAAASLRLAHPDALLPDLQEEEPRSCGLRLKATTDEMLEKIRARCGEVMEYAETLDEDARNSVLAKWEQGIVELSNALIGGPIGDAFLNMTLDINQVGSNYLG